MQYHPHELKWREPTCLLNELETHDSLVLLYSSLMAPHSGRYSFIGLLPETQLHGADARALLPHLSNSREWQENAWFGYLGYGLKNTLERLRDDAPGIITMPAFWMVRYRLILRFDHLAKTLTAWVTDDAALKAVPKPPLPDGKDAPDAAWERSVETLTCHLEKPRYLQAVERVRDAIAEGDLYQANITRKFSGRFDSAPDAHEMGALFRRLMEKSPAPYAALMRFADGGEGTWVLSTSPEQFLRITPDGKAESRPIKGSAPRKDDAHEDDATRHQLALSEKDRAENLMIVDLMRNDFSRGSVPGSVKVQSLFDITSYATVHHMSSTITAQKKPETPALEFVLGCFPPGSMTGAPKIEAMQLCSTLEGMERGIYSGALGMLGGDGSVDLSVVIRTLIVRGSQFEFQVGGAITLDSTPEGEWRETLVKARGIASALNISEETLASL